MGIDEAVSHNQRAPKRSRLARGTVEELMPKAQVRVRLDDQRLVTATPAAASKVNFVRLRVGDRVELEIAEHDPGRARVVKLLRPV